MKVETQQLPDSEVVLSFEVDDDRVERAMDVAYRRVAGRVNIAGFRKGKAPRALVERVVGRESLLEEALDDLLPQVYREALQETQLRAIGEPEFSVESLSPLRATATVVVEPDVELSDYQSIRRDPPEVTVSEEEVQEVIQQLRERHGQWISVERPAGIGDLVTLDVVGMVEDRRIMDYEDIEYRIQRESVRPYPGFAENLVGMESGESRSFDLQVPEEGEDELAGKTVRFQVTAKDVKVQELPELDDEFATLVGAYDDLPALRASIEQQLRDREESIARARLEEEILEEAISGATVTIPPKLLAREAERVELRFRRSLDSRGLTIEQYQQIARVTESEMDEQFRADAERSLRRGFVLQAIAKRESIEASDSEVDGAIRESLNADRADERLIVRALRQQDVRERARASVLERKAAGWLIEQATSVATRDAEPASAVVEGDRTE